MKIKIKAFATVKDICGFESTEVEASEGSSVQDIFTLLKKEYPLLEESEGKLLFAVNEEYAPQDTQLYDNDILAIFPPVSGG